MVKYNILECAARKSGSSRESKNPYALNYYHLLTILSNDSYNKPPLLMHPSHNPATLDHGQKVLLMKHSLLQYLRVSSILWVSNCNTLVRSSCMRGKDTEAEGGGYNEMGEGYNEMGEGKWRGNGILYLIAKSVHFASQLGSQM